MRKTKSARIAAVMSRNAMSDTEKLEKIQEILNEESDEAAAEGEDEEVTAEGEDEETTAEGEEEEKTAEGEEEETEAEGEEEDKTAKAALTRARAIAELPEAKGREKLAQTLAFTPGMSVKTARGILKAAPKASALRPHDPKLGAGGGGDAGDASEAKRIAAQVNEAYAKATGQAVKT